MDVYMALADMRGNAAYWREMCNKEGAPARELAFYSYAHATWQSLALSLDFVNTDTVPTILEQVEPLRRAMNDYVAADKFNTPFVWKQGTSQ